MYFFFKYGMVNPWPLSPLLVKKRHFCQNYSTIWVHKVNRMPLFSGIFHKIKGLMPMFCQKIIFSLKTHLSYVHMLSKKRPFYKKHCSHIFFQIFEWKTSCFHTHIKSKNFNSVKTKLYYGPKKSIGCSLFLILRENYCSNALFWNVHSLKIICSNAHILS